MSQRAVPWLPLLLLLAVVAVIGGAVTWSVLASAKLPDGPVDIVFDKAACAACGMHVGEPAFAAQLTTQDGRTQAFDDPGCLFLYIDEHHPDVHAAWFRHHQQPRWLSRDAVAFVKVDVTPMGFQLGAVDPGTADSIGYETARQQCLQRTSGHGGKR